MHALGGGTGSGTGSLLIQHLADEYPDRINISFPVFPSSKTSDVVLEPYNAVMSMPELTESCDMVMTLDNQALHNIRARHAAAARHGRRPHQGEASDTTLGELNGIIAEVMSGVTSSLRFPGQLNSDLRKLGVNLVPFPRLHFLMAGQSPVLSVDNYTSPSVKQLVKAMTAPQSFVVDVDPRQG